MLKIQKSKKTDLPQIMEIISHAQQLLLQLGIDQWQDGYPDQACIEEDILRGESFLIYNPQNETIGTVMLSTNKEPGYKNIDGAWLQDESLDYGVIHRLAISKYHRSKGYAKKALALSEHHFLNKGINSLKIDTHEDNHVMQKMLKSMGYTYCGVVYLSRGVKRLAFEKILTY